MAPRPTEVTVDTWTGRMNEWNECGTAACRTVPPLKHDEVKRSKARRSSWSSPAIRAKMAAIRPRATESPPA